MAAPATQPSGGNSNATFRVRRAPDPTMHTPDTFHGRPLTCPLGQGEARRRALVQHRRRQRYRRPTRAGPEPDTNPAPLTAVADAIRTSLGPRGMDKMIQSGKGETIITNDGNTMLKSMSVMHPTAKMLVNLSTAQDVEAGDGTTSVVVICGSLLGAADRLLGKGIHPSVISESFQRAAAAAVDVLHGMSVPITLNDTSALLQAANTSLSSKIVSQYSNLLGPMAVNAVTKTIDIKTADNVDLRNIRVVKKVGGTIEDSELVDGLVLTQPVLKGASGPVRMEKARIGLIQFQLSPPKPDVRLFPISDSPSTLLTRHRWRTPSRSTTTGKWTGSSRRRGSTSSTSSRRSRRPSATSS